MPYRDGPLEDLKVPITFTAGAALVVAAIVAAWLLLGDRRDSLGPGAWGDTRESFDGAMKPVGTVISAPVRWVGGAFDFVGDYFFAVSENRKLKREMTEMRRWRDTAIALKDVNERYETLMRLRTVPEVPSVVAQTILEARGPFNQSRLANSGSENGVKVGHPVLSEHGVVGRIVGVTRGASRILLLTDPAAKTPVLIDRTNARAILTGDGSDNPRLEFLRGVNPIREGDPILTSGDGGVFPRGLPVGVAVKGLDGVWRARLYSDRGAIDYVRILQFEDFAQLINPQALTVTTVPRVVEPPAPGALPLGGAPATGATPPTAAARPPVVAPTPGAARPPVVQPAAPRPATVTPRPAQPRPVQPRPAAPAPVQRTTPAPAAPAPAPTPAPATATPTPAPAPPG